MAASADSPARYSLGVAAGVLAVTIGIQALQSLAVLVVPILMPAAAAEIGVSVHFAGNFTAIVYASSMVAALMLAPAMAASLS